MDENRPTESDEGHGTEQVLILFPDDWAAYSPTLLNLINELRTVFDVHIHALDTGRIDNSGLDPGLFEFVKFPAWIARILRKTGLYRTARTFALARSAKAAAAAATHVIAIDADGACAAWILGKKFHFLSLEIGRHPLLRWIARKHALSIAIQSPARLRFQFDQATIDTKSVFFIQNAPSVSERQRSPTLRRPDIAHPRFVYLGNAIPLHGFYRMLALLEYWPGATLAVQGIVPATVMRHVLRRCQTLLDEGRLVIGSKYIADGDLENFLAQFDIGLCIYELDARHRRDFNYTSIPSGKMFNYFAAGLPVIASTLSGLEPVSAYKAGIRVADHFATTLRAAAEKIISDYDRYSSACLIAAEDSDFRKSAGRFIAFMRSGAVA